ncbi:MAG: hypothetical protein ABIZ07_04725 [Dermatophilaceae bacterium]
MTSKPTPDPSEGTTRAKWLDLSLTQLIGSSMAAATAAFLGSRLGLVGTIAGAAIGSLISATAASVYIGSLHRARTALLAARRLAPRPASTPQQTPQQSPLDGWRPIDRIGSRRLLATAGAVFALAAAFLTGLQLASGTDVTGTTIGTRTALVAPHDFEVKPAPAAPIPTSEPSSPTATPAPDETTQPTGGATQSATQPTDQATTPPAPPATTAPAPPAVTDPPATPAPTSPTPAPTAPAN